jgi:hypothetical protein
MAAVQSLCKTGLLLKNGLLVDSGNVKNIVKLYNEYSKNNNNSNEIELVNTYAEVSFKSVKANIDLSKGIDSRLLLLNVEIFENKVCDYSLEFVFRDSYGMPIIYCSKSQIERKELISKTDKIRCFCLSVNLPILARGDYSIDVMLVNRGVKFYQYHESLLTLKIESAIIPESGIEFKQETLQGSIFIYPKTLKDNYSI